MKMTRAQEERLELFKSGEVVCSEHVGGVIKAAGDELGENQIRFIITNESQDRHGDIVMAGGCKSEHYEKNPVVLAFHNSWSLMPVAKSLGLDKQESQILSLDEFGTEETLGEWGKTAQSFYLAYKNGFMSAVSIGFRALDWDYDAKLGGYLIKEWEKLEHSCIPIPSNREALAIEKAQLDELREAYEHVLDTSTPEDNPQRSLIEAARTSTKTGEPVVLRLVNETLRFTL